MPPILKMFATKKTHFDSIIGPGVRIEGDVTFTGDVRVDGHIKGNVSIYKSTSGTIVVGRDGRIDGKVSVSNAVVRGTVNGPVRATAVVGVSGGGRITGDVTYGRLVVRDHANIEGYVTRGNDNAAYAPVTYDEVRDVEEVETY
ncbi:MAG: polymer-forming cytoskeletal protein [Burkholderiales bacterium]